MAQAKGRVKDNKKAEKKKTKKEDKIVEAVLGLVFASPVFMAPFMMYVIYDGMNSNLLKNRPDPVFLCNTSMLWSDFYFCMEQYADSVMLHEMSLPPSTNEASWLTKAMCHYTPSLVAEGWCGGPPMALKKKSMFRAVVVAARSFVKDFVKKMVRYLDPRPVAAQAVSGKANSWVWYQLGVEQGNCEEKVNEIKRRMGLERRMFQRRVEDYVVRLREDYRRHLKIMDATLADWMKKEQRVDEYGEAKKKGCSQYSPAVDECRNFLLMLSPVIITIYIGLLYYIYLKLKECMVDGNYNWPGSVSQWLNQMKNKLFSNPTVAAVKGHPNQDMTLDDIDDLSLDSSTSDLLLRHSKSIEEGQENGSYDRGGDGDSECLTAQDHQFSDTLPAIVEDRPPIRR